MDSKDYKIMIVDDSKLARKKLKDCLALLNYTNVIEAADLVRFICPNYSKSCFQIRNEWMVDHSSRVIAVFNGQLGGTKNTIDYAKNRAVEICYA